MSDNQIVDIITRGRFYTPDNNNNMIGNSYVVEIRGLGVHLGEGLILTTIKLLDPRVNDTFVFIEVIYNGRDTTGFIHCKSDDCLIIKVSTTETLSIF